MLKFQLICILLIPLLLGQQPTAAADPSCSEQLTRSHVEQHLSTKTPYRAIANYNETPPHYPGCHPVRIWSIIRHGTRNPSKSVIKRAQERLKDIQQQLLRQPRLAKICSAEWEQLRQWSWEHLNADEDEKLLVAEGEDELIELAERMQLRFPTLLRDPYDPSWYFMKYTATQRTLKSAQSFATGLFGRHRIHAVNYPRPLHRDPVLRFYKLCDRWKTDVDKNPETLVNARRFYAEPQMQSAVEHVRSSTQLADIQSEDVELMYTVCAFETAWRRHNPLASVWCRFFDVASLKALEYAEDLEYYWNDGYGYELTHRIACPAMADMFKALENPLAGGANATFYFTHSGTLLKLLAHLGVAKDDLVLTHKHFDYERQWRTSRIDAFATNLAFVRYDCDQKEPQVLVLHQERAIHLPGCPKDNELCALSRLRQLYRNSWEQCDFEGLCQINDHTK